MSNNDFNQTTFFRPDVVSTSNSAQITIFDGSSEPIDIDLAHFRKAVISFGRDEKNDIVIRSKFVSRQHGYFKLINGTWIIENNPQSTNGLIYNGAKIDSKTLDDRDNIRIDNSIETSATGVLIVFSTGGKC